MCKTIAVILAAGAGNRVGSQIPKQYLSLNNKPVLLHSIETFQKNSNVDEIAVVCQDIWIDRVAEMVSPYPKARKLLIGGKERFQSSLAAISAYDEDDSLFLIHDAARPLVI